MPSFEVVFLLLVGAGALVAGAVLFVVLRGSGSSPAAAALAAGRFEEAFAGDDDLFVTAVAAKHLWRLDEAGRRLDRLLAVDPKDGDALLERGLVAAYAGDYPRAVACLDRALATRADLAEPLTLHRAWVELRRGARPRALELFEEVAVPLETKLRDDLGSGEPLFAEWFLHAAALWHAAGDAARADWAREAALASAPGSRLVATIAAAGEVGAAEEL